MVYQPHNRVLRSLASVAARIVSIMGYFAARLDRSSRRAGEGDLAKCRQ